MKKISAIVISLVVLLCMSASAAMAEPGLVVQVNTSVSCSVVDFSVVVEGGTSSYTYTWNFGDDVIIEETEAGISHDYGAKGVYEWSLTVTDGLLSGYAAGSVTIDGPTLTLKSDPFPPLVDMTSGEALVAFEAEVSGGVTPYTYSWDLNGDGAPDSADPLMPYKASFVFTQPGKYIARATVMDDCKLSSTDTLPVIVGDPESDSENGEEKGCHPVAQKIADSVNTLFPLQADTLYTCEEIFDIFTGGLTGSQVGFGKLQKAFKLTQSIEGLTWEQIRDWHLDGAGWGLLVQLDRFTDELEEYGIVELMELVQSGDATLGDIRTALRSAVRYGADFEDALARIAEGAKPGELGQLYRTAEELGVDPALLDEYLAMGMSLSDIRHAAKSAEQVGGEWQALLEARSAGYSWGDIKQAYKFADGSISVEEILAMGVKEYRKQARQDAQVGREDAKNQRTAEQIASRFGVSAESVWSVFEGTCGLDWGCVRKHFRGK